MLFHSLLWTRRNHPFLNAHLPLHPKFINNFHIVLIFHLISILKLWAWLSLTIIVIGIVNVRKYLVIFTSPTRQSIAERRASLHIEESRLVFICVAKGTISSICHFYLISNTVESCRRKHCVIPSRWRLLRIDHCNFDRRVFKRSRLMFLRFIYKFTILTYKASAHILNDNWSISICSKTDIHLVCFGKACTQVYCFHIALNGEESLSCL